MQATEETNELENGFKVLREYSRSIITKYLKSIKDYKTMIIEPSLMPVIENLLTNPKYEDTYLEGMCDLVLNKVSNLLE